ncbi:hypothetical protein B0H11DRAFT_2119499 [Mycena galericulata]|nr:hypothetical protein B0H11DRAFT_2119499 [Mycena galericulata]
MALHREKIMASTRRVVSIFGATGLQGSAVVESLLKDGTFIPRAITRNPESEASVKLKERGVEVVKGDSGDKASLLSALRGSEAVFAVTVPVIPPIFPEGPSELSQGTNMVDAAKEAGVKFFIFSSLPSIKRISAGKYDNVAHYDDKEAIEGYLKQSGLANASLLLGGFSDSLWTRNYLQKTATGFNISIPKYNPTALEAQTWVGHDVGAAALALLKSYRDPSKAVSGKAYPLVWANMAYPDFAAMISEALGVPVTVNYPESSGIPVVDAMLTAHAEYNGLYTDTPVPNPDLVALGAKLATREDFIEELKRHFGKTE